MKLEIELKHYPATNSIELRWGSYQANGTSIAEVFFNFVSAFRNVIARELFEEPEPDRTIPA